MNRAQRRLAERVERRDAPGINREIEKAYRQGVQDMTRYASKWTYAALILALQRTEHFGQKRLYRVLDKRSASSADDLIVPADGSRRFVTCYVGEGVTATLTISYRRRYY